MVEFGFQLRAAKGIAEPLPIKGATGEAQFTDEGLGQGLAHGFEIGLELGRAAFAFPILLADGIGDARRRLAALGVCVGVGDVQVAEGVVLELAGGIAEQSLLELAGIARVVLVRRLLKNCWIGPMGSRSSLSLMSWALSGASSPLDRTSGSSRRLRSAGGSGCECAGCRPV